LLAALITFLLFRVLQGDRIHAALCGVRSDLLLGLGVLLGITAAVWAVLLGMLATEFGRWLRQKGEALPYTTALAAPIFVSSFAFMMVMLAGCSDSRYVLYLDTFALVYVLINLVTMVRNVIGLVGLWQLWEQKRP